jgi:LacI family transcriptional regulator
MATIKEIAKACNVSIATVSNVLNNRKKVNENTKKLILETAKQMEYVPNYMAKNLKQKETKVIGIITEDLTVFNCPEIVDGIHAYLEEVNYSFLLGNLRLYKKYGNKFYVSEEYRNQISEEFRMMQAKQVDGIIYIGAHSREIRCLPNDINIPVVLAYGRSSDPEVLSVIFDDEKASYDAASLLIKRGHQKIGIIAGDYKSIHTDERLLGYQRALYEHKLLYNPELVYYGDWEKISGYEGAKKLCREGVTAIFSMNDIMACGIYEYAKEADIIIGKDLSIIGFDNRDMCPELQPSLATVALPLYKIGRKASELIIKLIKKEDDYDKNIIKIACEIIERDSISKTFKTGTNISNNIE